MTTAQEKVELEQVPLKSDIDPPPGTETEQMTKVENEPIKKKCTKWFCKKSKNGEVTTTEITTTDEKKKVCKWWNKNAHKENVDDEKQMTVGINMLDRDEKGLNNHIMMEFGDIFGEPDSNHSFQWTWRLAHRIFTSTSSFIYKLLTVILVIPVAIVFGILFAVFSAISIFICTPLGLLIGMPANAIAKVWSFAVHRVFDPLMSSCGLCCAGFANRKSEMHDSPTVLA